MRGLFNLFAKHRLVACQRGATTVEYALILAFIFLAIVGAVSQLAGKTIHMWGLVSDEVTKDRQ